MTDQMNFYRAQYKAMEKLGATKGDQFTFCKAKVRGLLDGLDFKPQRALELGSGMGLEAIAMSLEGIEVHAIEYLDDLVVCAEKFQALHKSQVHFMVKDFYDHQAPCHYDLVYYLDGFGLGSDADQERLLNHIKTWMTPGGTCVLEVYNPPYWQKNHGQTMTLSETIHRTYTYDTLEHAMVDTWYDSEGQVDYSQRLKCYDLETLSLMARALGLEVVKVKEGGAFDFERGLYHEAVGLDKSLNYMVFLKKL